jgi:hypothetical protein
MLKDMDPTKLELELLEAEDEELERLRQQDQRLVDYLNNLNLRSLEPIWQESNDLRQSLTLENGLKRAYPWPQETEGTV